jgi:GT2 family glycosyltransferase
MRSLERRQNYSRTVFQLSQMLLSAQGRELNASMKQIAVLITCHNRCAKTLAALTSLFEAAVPEQSVWQVFLVDDGSTDGTTNAVRFQFPQVTIIHGDGSLYWCGGMRRAWIEASKQLDYDAYLWLNDDTVLFPNALMLLCHTWESLHNSVQREVVVCGSTTDSSRQYCTYGGRQLTGPLITPNGTPEPVQLTNGNILLIPREIFREVGNLSAHFTHSIGDFDYSLRVVKKGYSCWIAPEYVGICDSGSSPAWTNPNVPLSKRISNLYSPKGGTYAPEYLRFIYRHFGILKTVKIFLSLHVRVMIPRIWTHK